VRQVHLVRGADPLLQPVSVGPQQFMKVVRAMQATLGPDHARGTARSPHDAAQAGRWRLPDLSQSFATARVWPVNLSVATPGESIWYRWTGTTASRPDQRVT
jgi:hypothetical protein